jgi:hypothetical protein
MAAYNNAASQYGQFARLASSLKVKSGARYGCALGELIPRNYILPCIFNMLGMPPVAHFRPLIDPDCMNVLSTLRTRSTHRCKKFLMLEE